LADLALAALQCLGERGALGFGVVDKHTATDFRLDLGRLGLSLGLGVEGVRFADHAAADIGLPESIAPVDRCQPNVFRLVGLRQNADSTQKQRPFWF